MVRPFLFPDNYHYYFILSYPRSLVSTAGSRRASVPEGTGSNGGRRARRTRRICTSFLMRGLQLARRRLVLKTKRRRCLGSGRGFLRASESKWNCEKSGRSYRAAAGRSGGEALRPCQRLLHTSCRNNSGGSTSQRSEGFSQSPRSSISRISVSGKTRAGLFVVLHSDSKKISMPIRERTEMLTGFSCARRRLGARCVGTFLSQKPLTTHTKQLTAQLLKRRERGRSRKRKKRRRRRGHCVVAVIAAAAVVVVVVVVAVAGNRAAEEGGRERSESDQGGLAEFEVCCQCTVHWPLAKSTSLV